MGPYNICLVKFYNIEKFNDFYLFFSKLISDQDEHMIADILSRNPN